MFVEFVNGLVLFVWGGGLQGLSVTLYGEKGFVKGGIVV